MCMLYVVTKYINMLKYLIDLQNRLLYKYWVQVLNVPGLVNQPVVNNSYRVTPIVT